MKRKLPFESPDSRTPPPSPFSAGGLSPITHLSPMQEEAHPAPGFQTPSPIAHGGHLTLTAAHALPAGYQTPVNGNAAPLLGIAFNPALINGGGMIIATPGAIGHNDMLNAMNPHAGAINEPSPIPPFPLWTGENEVSDGTDSLVVSSSDDESDTHAEVEKITDQDLLDVSMILTATTPIQHTPNHIHNIVDTITTLEIEGLTPLSNEETTNPFADGDTSSDSESDPESLNKAFILDDEKLDLQGEHSLFTLEELEEGNY